MNFACEERSKLCAKEQKVAALKTVLELLQKIVFILHSSKLLQAHEKSRKSFCKVNWHSC